MDKMDVQISENMYNASKATFKICKMLGLAPYEILLLDRMYKIKFSKKYLLFSYIFGTILISLVLTGLINDLNAGSSSLKMTSTKSAVITFCDVFFIVFIIVLGLFGCPFRLNNFWKLLNLLKDVDKLIKTNDGNNVNKAQKNKIIIILIAVVILLTYTMVVEDRTTDGYFSVKNYVVFYFLYIIVFIIEIQYWHLVDSIGRRFKKLNECLELDNSNNKINCHLRKNSDKLNSLFTVKMGQLSNYPENNKQFKILVHDMIRERRNKEITKDNLKNSLTYSSVEFITKISEAHGKLFEAVNAINDGFGFLSLVIIMSCLFHLVVTPYFLLLDLLVETPSLVANLVLQFLWVVTHLVRLIIIIEPCYQTCQEAKNTNPLVAKMLCHNFDDYYKKQIAGAITTYLVILLQFR